MGQQQQSKKWLMTDSQLISVKEGIFTERRSKDGLNESNFIKQKMENKWKG